jgi:hypothetical protein
MTLREVVESWPHLSWIGPYGRWDKVDVDPGTAIITSVEVVSKMIRIAVTVQNRQFVSAIDPDRSVFAKVVAALTSAIGQTLNQAGEITIV